jgi:replicative DNA helicase
MSIHADSRADRGRSEAPARPSVQSPFVPRSNIDAETAVIGAMLRSPDATATAAEMVSASDFYRPKHGAIFDAIMRLFNRNVRVDALTVHEELKLTEMGRAIELSELMQLVSDSPVPSSVETYAAIVHDLARLRSLNMAASQLHSIANEASSAEVALDEAEAIIFDISNDARTSPVASASDLANAMVREAMEAADSPGLLRGLSIGFSDLDNYLRGLRPGQFFIVGARPSIGKTAFGLSIALATAKAGVGVLFCSLEMSRKEIALRLGSMVSGLDVDLVSSGRMSPQQFDTWTRAASVVTKLPIWVDDDGEMDLFRIKARARRRQREGLGLVIVDYLQLVAVREAENRQVEVSKLSRGLKVMAKQLGVPVIAMSQLSRGLETRADKTPLLADLRESGSLEQDADVVLLLSRDLEPGSLRRAILDVHLAKNRNGRIGKVELAWRPHVTSIASLAKGPPPATPLTDEALFEEGE